MVRRVIYENAKEYERKNVKLAKWIGFIFCGLGVLYLIGGNGYMGNTLLLFGIIFLIVSFIGKLISKL
jgi:hypothetical protein